MKTIKVSRESVPKIGRILAESECVRVKVLDWFRKYTILLTAFNRYEYTMFYPYYMFAFNFSELEYLKTELSKPKYAKCNWAKRFLEQIN